MGTPRRPLEGVRIVAVEQYGAGPHRTLQLADLGAEIVNVENAGDGGDGVGTAYAAAFCLGDRPLSYLAGDAGTSNIDSPGFRQAMATAANELLPQENPEYNDCGRRKCF